MLLNELPEVLTARDIADHQRISRRRVYELFDLSPDAGGILNYCIGISRRVVKNDYLQWIEARRREQELRNSKAGK